MLKVCHMTSVHNRYDVRICEKECVSLAHKGYNVTLLVNDEKKDEIYKGVNISSTRFVPKSRLNRFISLKRIFLKKALEINADIYHLHDPELLLLVSKLKKKGKKVIFDSHENYYEQIKEKDYIPKLIRSFIAKLYLFFETNAVRNIEAVIFPCTFNGGKDPFQGRSQKTIIINNYPKLEEFYDKYTEKQEVGEFNICHVGSLTYDRGIYHNIIAARQAGAIIIIAGSFISNQFYEEIINLPEYKNVDYLGYLNREEVLKVYKKCKIGICTLLDKGQYFSMDNLATKVYEYMSMGLPVIISDYHYARNVMEECRFGVLVNPDSITEIKDAIQLIKENPIRAIEMGNNGRRLIHDKFNWSIEEKKLFELYQDLSIS